jgi:hypothetical protein
VEPPRRWRLFVVRRSLSGQSPSLHFFSTPRPSAGADQGCPWGACSIPHVQQAGTWSSSARPCSRPDRAHQIVDLIVHTRAVFVAKIQLVSESANFFKWRKGRMTLMQDRSATLLSIRLRMSTFLTGEDGKERFCKLLRTEGPVSRIQRQVRSAPNAA